MNASLRSSLAALLLVSIGGPASASPGFLAHEALRDDGQHLGILVTSRSWASLEAEWMLSAGALRAPGDLMLGFSVEAPIVSTVLRPGPDFVRGGPSAALRLDLWGPTYAVVDARLRIDVNGGNLGLRVAPDVLSEAIVGARFGSVTTGVYTSWQQVIFAAIEHSHIVRDAFDVAPGAAAEAPTGAFLWFPAERLTAGAHLGVDITDAVALTASGGWVWAPQALEAGPFDFMMIGLWPFYADVGVALRW